MISTTQAVPNAQKLLGFKATGDKLTRLSQEMITIFPEREHLIMQMLYAFMTGEHVLIYGVKGTGKSDLVNTFFECFTDAKRFSVSLSKFMTESAIVGIPDPKKLREEGRLEYNIEETIVDCHFAELDEILDASSPLLRVLLTILNERQFKRGRQNVKAELHTAIASTNLSHVEAIKRDPALDAVIDRFLFKSRVDYLQNDDSRIRMYTKYLMGAKPKTQITYAEIDELHRVVRDANQITDLQFVVVYNKILEAYKEKSKKIISDRTACKLLKLVEANALMNGRFAATYDDIVAIKYALCEGGEPKEVETFDDVVLPLIEEANATLTQNIDHLQVIAIEQLRKNLPSIPASVGAQKLLTIRRELVEHKKEVSQIIPSLDSTKLMLSELERDIENLLEESGRLIDGQ